VEDIHLCELCLREFEPKEVKPGVLMLQRFKGYTVDVRLQEFRNVNSQPMQFIAFTSPKGQRLLAQMHEEAMQHARTNLADLEKRLHSSFEKFLKRLKQEEVTQ
jgi:hypothetical protein